MVYGYVGCGIAITWRAQNYAFLLDKCPIWREELVKKAFRFRKNPRKVSIVADEGEARGCKNADKHQVWKLVCVEIL